LLLSCGRKTAPVPKETLVLPPPEWVNISTTDDGVLIENPSDEIVIVERAFSEVGDLRFPYYTFLARISPNSNYTDNTTERDSRYIYRLSTKHKRYDINSAPITRTVSYRGRVAIDSVKAAMVGERLCVSMTPTRNVSYITTTINGQTVSPDKDGCYGAPLSTNVLFVAVPYSENDVPGMAYSERIDVTGSGRLVPPQNLQVLRRESSLILNWDSLPNVNGYRVVNVDEDVQITETVYTFRGKIDGCVKIQVYALYDMGESTPVTVESCP
jgi:hypothetical protein